MAGKDGTGPLGNGPLTGRGFGPCGQRTRSGKEFGRGFRCRNWISKPMDLTKEEKVKILKAEKKSIEQELEELEK